MDLPLYLLEPVILTTILYWMVGLNPDVLRFFIACGIILLVTQVLTTAPSHHDISASKLVAICYQVVLSVGYFLSCLSPNVDVALAVAPVVIIPFMLFGGFFLNSGSVPV